MTVEFHRLRFGLWHYQGCPQERTRLDALETAAAFEPQSAPAC